MPTPAEIERATARRVEVVETIRESVKTRGYPPSISELAAATGVSFRQTRKDLDVLVDAGILERDPGVTRGLRVIKRRRAST